MHFYSVKKRPEIPILSTFINNEILQNFKGKNHGLVLEILEESLFLSRGGSRIFFRRGCTRLLLYSNTNKPHSFFFFAEYQLY